MAEGKWEQSTGPYAQKRVTRRRADPAFTCQNIVDCNTQVTEATGGFNDASTDAAAVCLDITVLLAIIYLLLGSCLERVRVGGMQGKASEACTRVCF